MLSLRSFSAIRNTKVQVFCFSSQQSSSMPKKEVKGKKSKKATEDVRKSENQEDGAVCKGPNGQIFVKVLAKPGANQTAVTDVSVEGVGVRIAAPPVDGEANAELIKYMSRVLGVRKSDVSLDKGARSRVKILEIVSSELDIGTAMDKLKKAAEG